MASLNLTITINSPPGLNVTFAQVPGLTAPVPIGTEIGAFTVTPPAWAGVLVLSGADGAAFGTSLVGGVWKAVAAAELAARDYNLVVTPAP
jgi:hypothetical protein